MADLARIENLFFAKSGMDRRRVEGIAADALAKADDGELFLEYVQHEALVFDDAGQEIAHEVAARLGRHRRHRGPAPQPEGLGHSADHAIDRIDRKFAREYG